MSDEIEETPFHFDPDTANVLGREPAGRGRIGPELEPTPDRVADVDAAAASPNGQLQELPRGHSTDGVTIYVPAKPGVLIGQLMIDALGQALPLNVVDPRGCPWQDGESNAFVQGLVDACLSSEETWLEFRNPIEGHTFQVTRRTLERLLMVSTARLEIKEPPVPTHTPGGIPITRDVPLELRRAMGL